MSTPQPEAESATADATSTPAPSTPAPSEPATEQPLIPAQQSNEGSAPGALGKRRGPFAVWLLSLITFGIYGLVWYYKINSELRDFNPSIQVRPGMALLALFVPIAGWVSVYNTGKRIGQAQQLAGLDSTCSGSLGLLACWFFGLHTIYYQGQMNRV